MELKELLAKSGFSDKEIAVYQAMLALGPALVSDIAARADINRSTTYVILGTLAKRGLVSDTERRGVKIYHPLPPEKLVTQFEQVAEQYAEYAKSARKIVSQLKIKAPAKGVEPKVHFFTGAPNLDETFASTVHSLEAIRTKGLAKPTNAPGMAIYDDKVVFTSPTHQGGLVIESPEIAEAIKKAFKK
jgi:sugar-specific transcriptional regulator TrmB